MGGGLQLSGSLYEEAAVPGGGGSITIVALGALAIAVVAVARVARVHMPSEPAPSSWSVLARAAIESAGVAALMATIVAFARISTGVGAETLVIRSDPGAVFLVLLSVLTATLFLTREPRRRRTAGQHAGAWARACREASVYLAVQGATFGTLALLGAVILAKDLGSSGGFFALLPLLGNLAVAGATLGHFGSLVFVSSTGVGELAPAGDLLGG
ncbi:hypothetical protein G7067_03000 [Leucobacter insecticola]|uniref:Uncharacterized protein n=1 Tax=Leucobacter insecticola TaxID=2714934 RepID=A0A6G8FGY7_9MICO|nr:hypothetical protein [Leucobacter insecticola]QIM15617.1 hypothetical protein G7067_03000 [Leucobacter insecticola]